MSGGATEANEVLDSIVNREDTTFYHFTVVSWKNEITQPSHMGGPLITENKTQLTVLSSEPSTIQEHTSRFTGLKWILPEKSSMLFFESIRRFARFCPIPIDPSEAEYTVDDFFVVRVTDSIGMRWSKDPQNSFHLKAQILLFEGETDVTGTMVNDSSEAVGGCGGSPVLISSSAAYNGGDNPFHFIRLGVTSRCCTFKDSSSMEQDTCYGLQLLAYKPVAVGAKPYSQREGLPGSYRVQHKYSLLGRKVPTTLGWADNFFIVSDRKRRQGIGYLVLEQASSHP